MAPNFSRLVIKKRLRGNYSNDLKPSKHFSDVIKTANNLSVSSKELLCINLKKVILTLLNALVRSHLEYCIQFWSPYYKRKKY